MKGDGEGERSVRLPAGAPPSAPIPSPRAAGRGLGRGVAASLMTGQTLSLSLSRCRGRGDLGGLRGEKHPSCGARRFSRSFPDQTAARRAGKTFMRRRRIGARDVGCLAQRSGSAREVGAGPTAPLVRRENDVIAVVAAIAVAHALHMAHVTQNLQRYSRRETSITVLDESRLHFSRRGPA